MAFLVGDVSSSARSLPPLGDRSLQIARSKGPYLWDANGECYVDTSMGFGATILGHAPEPVIAAVEEALRSGPSPAFAHVREEAAAAAIAELALPLQRVIFTNSGSEAVHLACRAARAATGKKLIAKIGAGFNGWFDEIAFGNAGSFDATFGDQKRPASNRIVLLRYNDLEDIDRLFDENSDIAGVIFEPMLANAGCILASLAFLRHLQETVKRHGALLIADEVLMGCRLKAGLTSHALGLDPDLVTLGKAIGSGVPVGAVAGRPEVMECFVSGRALRGGTYSGNPMACASILATSKLLKVSDYPALLDRGNALRSHIVEAFAKEGIRIATSGYGSVFSIWFADTAPTDYASAERLIRADLSERMHLTLRRLGVLVMPSPYGRLYVSFSHGEEAISRLKAAFSVCARDMAKMIFASE